MGLKPKALGDDQAQLDLDTQFYNLNFQQIGRHEQNQGGQNQGQAGGQNHGQGQWGGNPNY
uniref:Uncharacterized protein n=1 Tax=Romanomermis culicivorax TaxID=13658 RepID=A0A915IAL3_ROMCU